MKISNYPKFAKWRIKDWEGEEIELQGWCFQLSIDYFYIIGENESFMVFLSNFEEILEENERFI